MARSNNSTPPIEEQPPDEPTLIPADNPTLLPSGVTRTDGPLPAAAPSPGKGEVVLLIEHGGDVFSPGGDDLPVVARTGTAVPAKQADELIDIAAANNVTIVKLES